MPVLNEKTAAMAATEILCCMEPAARDAYNTLDCEIYYDPDMDYFEQFYAPGLWDDGISFSECMEFLVNLWFEV